MKKKTNAFVGNTGHFDDEIDLAGSEGSEGTKIDNIKPQVSSRLLHRSRCDRRRLQADCSILGCASGHHSFLFSCPFTNQRKRTLICWNDVYLLPVQVDEKVTTLHLAALCAALTVFAQTVRPLTMPDSSTKISTWRAQKVARKSSSVAQSVIMCTGTIGCSCWRFRH